MKQLSVESWWKFNRNPEILRHCSFYAGCHVLENLRNFKTKRRSKEQKTTLKPKVRDKIRKKYHLKHWTIPNILTKFHREAQTDVHRMNLLKSFPKQYLVSNLRKAALVQPITSFSNIAYFFKQQGFIFTNPPRRSHDLEVSIKEALTVRSHFSRKSKREEERA